MDPKTVLQDLKRDDPAYYAKLEQTAREQIPALDELAGNETPLPCGHTIREHFFIKFPEWDALDKEGKVELMLVTAVNDYIAEKVARQLLDTFLSIEALSSRDFDEPRMTQPKRKHWWWPFG